MIYLITGTPGAGKTLYAVSTLVQSLLKQKPVKNGKEMDRRLVVDGVPDLLLPHEKLCTVGEDEKGIQSSDGDSVLNWPQWCQAGDVIFIDEVQRIWRPRGMGSKPPECVKALETHRHKGVDFVIVTQDPMLIDQNVRRLVGRHLHVRRVMGMKRAIVYEWDGCNVARNPRQSITSSYFNYPKSAYDLYKSSELHTKPAFKLPMWVAVPVLALVGAVFVVPKAFATLTGAATGKGVSSSAPAVDGRPKTFTNEHGQEVTVQTKTETVVVPAAASSAPASAASSAVVASAGSVELSGCITVLARCSCFDGAGKKVIVSHDVCSENSASESVVPKQVVEEFIPAVPRPGDMDALAFLHRKP